jgi:hypothetical protein
MRSPLPSADVPSWKTVVARIVSPAIYRIILGHEVSDLSDSLTA